MRKTVSPGMMPVNAARRCFVDTNVFLYALDSTEPEKAHAAGRWLDALWEAGAGRISRQGLHEFYVNPTRRMGAPKEAVREQIELLTLWQPADSTSALVHRAWEWTDTAQLSYWDALIVAAAETTGCPCILTEDLQPGRRLGNILVVNPFTTPPEAI